MKEYLKKPIPLAQIPDQEKEPQFVSEPLVPVQETERIHIRMQYPLLGMKHGEKRCMLRKTVYDMLQKASESLEPGYAFLIWDAWRPFALQKELFTAYSADIIRDFHLENLSEKERTVFISQFVADPIKDRIFPPAHTTGGAIDLTMEKDGIELDFGTGFDAFSEKTNTAWYEQHNENPAVRENRRMLYHEMIHAGFTNLPSEWWHFEYGDRNWSRMTSEPALYEGIWTIGGTDED
ncbi:M15 family metallopeptidase [Anaerolactibacter massiliensis]|uniref:M15 family metallopeptidase n=1 Tax=Anaerolactibacter massiliensis TaxID=2044573 RepID=UPI000CF90381|nr:M15 family metallopeptidase [Anaerolactibacter massiliensis]